MSSEALESALGSAYKHVYGNAHVYVSPINIIGLKYNITAYCDYLQIGCQGHTFEQWSKFSDEEIGDMEEGALDWWNKNKTLVLSLEQTLNSH